MWTKEKCEELDQQDSLARFKNLFHLPANTIYLDGNSLGVMPKSALSRAKEVIEKEWGKGLVRSWNSAGWFHMPNHLGNKLAKLLGANENEVVVTDTISINVFKTVAMALKIQQKLHPKKRVIVAERDSFPSDLYIMQGLNDLLGQNYELRLFDDKLSLEDALSDDVAVLEISHVNYRTGRLYNMEKITELAHSKNILTIWDLAHSAGAVEVELNKCNADFAIGCTYKFLNAGPGAPGFVWMASRHNSHNQWQPISGWWGHAAPFNMEEAYRPAPGISRFLCGSQPIISLALVECGLDAALAAPMKEVRAKSLALTDLLISLVQQRCAQHSLKLITPTEHHSRASHVSFMHPEGYPIIQALIAQGVIGDYREPEVMRFGITPLYLSYTDIWNAVNILVNILDNRLWDKKEFKSRSAVT